MRRNAECGAGPSRMMMLAAWIMWILIVLLAVSAEAWGRDAATLTAKGVVLVQAADNAVTTVSKAGYDQVLATANSYVTHFYNFGDSITTNDWYCGLIQNAFGYPARTNKAIAGSVVWSDGNIDDAYTTEITSGTLSTVLTGYNNFRYFGGNATALAMYERSLMAELAYLSIPDTAKVYADEMDLTGTWSTPTTYGGVDFAQASSTQGDTAECTLYGTVLYIGGTAVNSGGGTLRVTVDGANKGTVACTGAVVDTFHSNRSFAPFVFRISGLSNGPHAVVISVDVAGTCQVDWAGGNEHRGHQFGPAVYVGNALRMKDEDYTEYGVSGTLADNRAHNLIIGRVCRTLARDGLNVVLVPATDKYDPYTGVGVDHVHPNQATGHVQIANAFIGKMRGYVSPAERGREIAAEDTPDLAGINLAQGGSLRLWGSADGYRIRMDSGTEFSHGPVNGYAIKMTMLNLAGRGYVWGADGVAPVVAFEAATGKAAFKGEVATSTTLRGAALAVTTAVTGGAKDWGKLASAPTPTGEGDEYYDTVTHKKYVWDGSAWQACW